MKNLNYYVKYDDSGNVVRMSLVKTSGVPKMRGQWKEVFKLCCDPNYEDFEKLTLGKKAYLIVDNKGIPMSGPIVRFHRPSGVRTMQIPQNICCDPQGSVPTANVVTTATLGNPGGTGFLTIPATNFGGTDDSGVISFLRITNMPANVNTLRVNNVNYTSGNIGTLPDIPTNALGQPTWGIAIDPIDGAVTAVISYYTINPDGAISLAPGTVSVPMFVKPDLTPVLSFSPLSISGLTPYSSRVAVSEVAGVNMTNPSVVVITKDPRMTLVFGPTDTTVGGVAVDNASWSYDSSNPIYHIFTRSTALNAHDTSTFGFTGVFDGVGSTGSANITATIQSGSSEGNTSNNSSTVTLTVS